MELRGGVCCVSEGWRRLLPGGDAADGRGPALHRLLRRHRLVPRCDDIYIYVYIYISIYLSIPLRATLYGVMRRYMASCAPLYGVQTYRVCMQCAIHNVA